MAYYSTSPKGQMMVQEPAVAYSVHKNKSIGSVLDQEAPSGDGAFDEFELIKWIRRGLTKGHLLRLSIYLGLTIEELCHLFHISTRTWQRKKQDSMLGPDISEHGIELAALVAKGIEVLGSIDSLQQWIRSSVLVLGNKPPLEFLDTTIGTRVLINVLGRIEFGVYS